jgi:transposase
MKNSKAEASMTSFSLDQITLCMGRIVSAPPTRSAFHCQASSSDIGGTMMKAARARYTSQFKEEAVHLVKGGKRVATVAKNLGLAEQTLRNWVNAAGSGGLKGPTAPAVSVEQSEISRLRTKV